MYWVHVVHEYHERHIPKSNSVEQMCVLHIGCACAQKACFNPANYQKTDS